MLLLTLVLSCAGWGCFPGAGQTPAEGRAQNEGEGIEPSSPRAPALPGTGGEQGILKLDVLVTDSGGNPVAGLSKRDFSVLDDGRPNDILAFRAFDDKSAKAVPPVQVILFLDSLDLPNEMAEFERQEVERFLRQDGGHLRRPTSVYGVSNKGFWMLTEMNRLNKSTANGNQLADELSQDKGTHRIEYHDTGESKIGINSIDDLPEQSLKSPAYLKHYPVNAALQAVSAIAVEARQKPGRKLLLWIGSGCCQGSGEYLTGPTRKGDQKKVFDLANWVSTLLREAHVTLYSFSEEEVDHDPAPADQPPFILPRTIEEAHWMGVYKKTFAIESGGRVLAPDPLLAGKPDELMNQINDVMREADVFYMLSVDATPAGHPDEYHDLTVLVNRPDLTARTKTGYYDQTYYVDGPETALKRVTMQQLEDILKEDRGDHDGDLAKQLSYLELTERMNSARLRNWSMVFRGKKTRAALIALSDASAFLIPPPEEVLKDPAPDAAAQLKILSATRDYLDKTMPKLPNFYATRTTVRYEETPALHQRGASRDAVKDIDFQPLHQAETAKATVQYRNGKEVVEAKEKRTTTSNGRSLITHGTFGPLLRWVDDALDDPETLTWTRWEKGPEGKLAVYQWKVPLGRSPYSYGGCCLPDGDGKITFRKASGYIGEIVVDPVTGTILRMSVRSVLNSSTPLVRFDIMIEYGTTIVGGIPYVCPLRSVTISRMRSVIEVKEWDQSFQTYGPYWTLLNDVSFDDYHRFRSDFRMIASDDTAPAQD